METKVISGIYCVAAAKILTSWLRIIFILMLNPSIGPRLLFSINTIIIHTYY